MIGLFQVADARANVERMSGACAICLGAITRETRFVLIGTEAVHRSCAITGQPTRGQKLQHQVADLEVELARRQRIAASDRREFTLMRKTASKTVHELRADLADRDEQIATAAARAAGARAALEGQVQALQARLAVLSDPALANATATPDPAGEEDPSAERFRLLEFT